MEIEAESNSSQTDSRIALAMKAVLGIVLSASLVAGGRQIVAASAGQNDGASNIAAFAQQR